MKIVTFSCSFAELSDSVQLMFFSVVASKVKENANGARTFLEIVKARFGTSAHLLFLVSMKSFCCRILLNRPGVAFVVLCTCDCSACVCHSAPGRKCINCGAHRYGHPCSNDAPPCWYLCVRDCRRSPQHVCVRLHTYDYHLHHHLALHVQSEYMV